MRLNAAIGVALAAGVAAMSWTALTLAEFGHFVAIIPILVFPAAAAAVFTLLSGGRSAKETPAATAQDLLAVGMACATLFLSLPPDEILVGGQDPGVYIHTAAAVARTGSLVLVEPDLAALGEIDRRYLVRIQPAAVEPFPGVYLRPDGRISPQFFHLYPCLMAVAWSIGGIRAALLVNPLLNVAAILALYATAALLLGRRWALAAALLHALAAAQLRQAKFPTAELMAQFFLLAGAAVLALATLDDDTPPALAPLAGAMLGMAILTRYDSLLFLVPLAVALLWGMGIARRTRKVVAALATLAVFCVQAWLHQRYFAPFYRPLGGLVGGFLAAAVLLIPVVLLVRPTSAWQRLVQRLQRRETALRIAAAVLLVLWVMFGWFIRPGLAGPGRIGHWFRHLVGDPPFSGFAQLLAGAESVDMLYLVDLLGVLGLLAAMAGIAMLVVTQRQLWATAWLTASIAVLVVFTLNIFHDHFLMWVSRRFVPVVMPLASIGIAAAAAFIARARQGRWQRSVCAGAALVAAAIWLNIGPTSAMASGREWPGLIAWYERFEKAIPKGAELFCDQPGFAAPLRFISGHRAYELPGRTVERVDLLLSLMRYRAAAGRQILYLSQQPFEDPAARGLVPLGSYPLRSSMLLNTRRGVPVGTKPRGADFVLYSVHPI